MKIGETISIKCIKATHYCEGCMFEGIDECNIYAPDNCLGICREDGESVIFIEAK